MTNQLVHRRLNDLYKAGCRQSWKKFEVANVSDFLLISKHLISSLDIPSPTIALFYLWNLRHRNRKFILITELLTESHLSVTTVQFSVWSFPKGSERGKQKLCWAILTWIQLSQLCAMRYQLVCTCGGKEAGCRANESLMSFLPKYRLSPIASSRKLFSLADLFFFQGRTLNIIESKCVLCCSRLNFFVIFHSWNADRLIIVNVCEKNAENPIDWNNTPSQ